MAEDELGENDPKLGQLYYELGKAYLTEEKYDQAISNFENTLKLLSPSNTPPSVLSDLNSLLAKCYEKVNDYPTAIDFYTHAIQYFPEGELRFSESHIMNYCSLASLYCSIGKAQQAYDTLYSILQEISTLNNKHWGIGVYFTKLSLFSRHIGKVPEALHYSQTAISILKSPEMFKPELLNDARAELAMNRSAEGKYEEAEKMMREVINERLQCCKEDSNLVRYKNSLAMIQQANSQHAHSIATYKDAIETCKRLNIMNTQLGYSVYNNLASSLIQAGNFNEALGAYLSANKIAVEIYGEISEQSADDLTHIVNIYSKLQQHQQAIQHAENALEINKQIQSDNKKLGKSLLLVGELHHLYGDSNTAKSNLEQGVNILKPLSSELQDETLPAGMGHLAMIYLSQDRTQDAKNLMEEALNIKKRIFGTENHPSIAESYLEFGIFFQKTKLLSQSLECLNKAYSISQNTLGIDSPLTLDILDAKALLLISEKKYDEGIQVHKEVLSVKSKIYGENSGEVGRTYHKIGHAYFEKGDIDNALGHYLKGTQICERFNAKDRKLGKYYANLAELFNAKGEVEREQEFLRKAIQMYQKNGETMETIAKLQERLIK